MIRVYKTGLLVPGDLGRLGTLIYVVTRENLQPKQAKNTNACRYCVNAVT